MTAPVPSDDEVLRSVYRRLDRKAMLADHPGLSEEQLTAWFRRVKALLERTAPPLKAEPKPAVAPGPATFTLNTDGGSRGNPGPAAFGLVLQDPAGCVVAEKGVSVGRATSNEAEYRGVIAGLEEARRLGASDLLIRSDSELLVRQLNGEYRVKSRRLMPFFLHARKLLAGFGAWRAVHIPREENARADELANQAMDREA